MTRPVARPKQIMVQHHGTSEGILDGMAIRDDSLACGTTAQEDECNQNDELYTQVAVRRKHRGVKKHLLQSCLASSCSSII